MKEQDNFYVYLWRIPGTPNATSLEDLDNQSLAVINGFSYGGFITKVTDPANNIRLQHTSSHLNALKMLLSGRVDYLLDYEKPVNETLAGMPPVKLLKHLMVTLKMGFMVTTNTPYGERLGRAIDKAVYINYISKDVKH
jgi:polar amino acid transport system substrate-binding protein